MLSAHAFSPSLPRVPGLTAATTDGVSLPVLATPRGGMIAFDWHGPVELVLEREGGWDRASVKPARAGAVTRVEGSRLFVGIAQGKPLLVECPGGFLLSLLARPPVGEPPSPRDGGRLLRFGPGEVHEPGALCLRGGDVLWLDPGAWVRGQVHASGASRLTIGGRGVLENPRPAAGRPGLRTILLDHCRDVVLGGVHLVARHGWMVTLGGCERVVVDGLSEESSGPGTDGIDIVGSRGVAVRRCFLLNGDDNVALKAMDVRTQAQPPAVASSTFDGDWTGPVADVVVEDCAFWNDHGGSAMEIGYETRTERIGDVVFRGIDVMAVHGFGCVFGIHAGDRARVEDILWEDIHVEHHYDKLVDFRILWSRWSRDAERGQVRRVTLRGVRAAQSPYNAGYTASLVGGWDASHRITGVSFEDFLLDGRPVLDADALSLHAKQAEGIRFRA